MKFFRYLLCTSILYTLPTSCKKDAENVWQTDVRPNGQTIKIHDISKEFYDLRLPLEVFQQKYPWFQGTVSDEDYAIRRADTAEAKIYRDAIAKIDQEKLARELTQLFSRIKHYFPEIKTPEVFLYSSALQGIMEPVFYHDEENKLFIDVSAFMGENNANYQGVESYWQTSMNPQNIVPKVSLVFAQHFVPQKFDHQKFIDELVYNGKIMTLQDAFLPEFRDELKIGYTPKQLGWAVANEVNIWSYFVENNLVFSDDQRLKERFINPGPFSKFYTEIDNESSPRIGIFVGWQICRKFYNEKPGTKLTDFLQLDSQTIFNESNYKPKD